MNRYLVQLMSDEGEVMGEIEIIAANAYDAEVEACRVYNCNDAMAWVIVE